MLLTYFLNCRKAQEVKLLQFQRQRKINAFMHVKCSIVKNQELSKSKKLVIY